MDPSEKPVNTLPGASRLAKMTGHLYLRHFSLFFGYAAWLLIPLVISLLFFLAFNKETADIANLVLNVFLYGVLTSWLTVVIIQVTPLLAAKKIIRTRQVSMNAWLILVPFLLISIVVTLATLLGLIAFIIPGIILSVWFAFAATIVILEHKGVIESLRASRELSRGRFLPILWRLIAGVLIFGGCYFIGLLFMTMVAIMLSGGDAATYLASDPTVVDEVLFRIVEILAIPPLIVYQTLLYLEATATLETP